MCFSLTVTPLFKGNELFFESLGSGFRKGKIACTAKLLRANPEWMFRVLNDGWKLSVFIFTSEQASAVATAG